ncbi:MAG: helix-turn-helix domain-containing protein [archaeon]|nr:helix-turn-helix domain-containing protein [archaeon]MCP8314262.1 helix-turn-helix domain-containing protein [archaeon]MCP8318089.1 helix-turn-helix domain-containing protein [archaeon]MCP8319955.1 helix-turn-helix domain-containing protein [archaeon]
MKKYLELKTRLSSVEILRLIKEDRSYEELSSILGLSAPILSRYINGHVLPSLERSKKIIEAFKEQVTDLIKRRIKFEDERIFDHSAVIYNPSLLDKIGKLAFHEFSSLKVDKVLTVETDGIPLAVQVSREFDVNFVVAKNRKEMGIRNFIEVKRVFSSGAYSYLFIPKGSMEQNDHVLIVDDAVRTGFTLETLLELCKKCGAEPIGIFAIICFEDTLDRLKQKLNYPIKVLVRI